MHSLAQNPPPPVSRKVKGKTYGPETAELGLDGHCLAALAVEGYGRGGEEGLLVDGDCFSGAGQALAGSGGEGAFDWATLS